MKKMRLCGLALSIAMALCLSVTQAGAKTFKFRFAQITPATHPYYSAISLPWAQEIEKRTNGQVQITLYPAGTLVGGNVMYSSIVDGITDIGTSSFGWERGRHPMMDGFACVPGFPSATVATKVANEVVRQFKLKELADTHLLFVHTCAPMHMWTKTAVRSLEDLKGMEIRAAGITGKLVKLMGGVPVSATQSQVYEMLSKGIVKGSISSLDVLKGFRQAEVVQFVTLAHFHVAYFFVSMNLEKWNSLPSEIQKVFDEVSQEYIEISGRVWDKASEEGLQYAKDEGLEIITLSPEEKARWHAAYNPLKEDYLKSMEEKGLPGKAFLENIQNLMEKYR